jgi:Ca-activated chloride channel family protein
MRLANPEALWLLALLPAALWVLARAKRRPAARFSSLAVAGRLPIGLAVWGPTLLITLRLAALALLIVALARPQTSDATVRTHNDGIAIQLVIDNSYSMRTRDYDQEGEAISRLEAVKHAVRLFVAGGEHGLKGRPNDKIGIITFARDPDVVCPATLDHAAVLDALDRIQLAPPVGTNIGDALAWALDRLRHEPTKEKVVILLSDGAHNVKEGLPPLEAAQLAADLKIKVYTIGAVGNRFESGGRPRVASLADMVRQMRGTGTMAGDSVDEPMMERIAEQNGGQYYRATDTSGLLNIYQEIDRLETTRMEQTARVRYREWFVAFLVPAVLLLALEQMLAATRLLRVP